MRRFLALVLASAFIAAAPAQAPDAQIPRDAGRIDPARLLELAAKLQKSGDVEGALFWFFAGQLRSRYLLAIAPDEARARALDSTVGTIGALLSPQFPDHKRTAEIIDNVLAWDRETEVNFSWLSAKDLPPPDEWAGKFEAVRADLVQLRNSYQRAAG